MSYRSNDHRTFSIDWLPARINPEQTATILGFNDHDIPILIKTKLLIPLGKPVPNAVKYFARVEIERLAQDPAWLAKATNAIATYWKNQNERKRQKAAARQSSTQAFAE